MVEALKAMVVSVWNKAKNLLNILGSKKSVVAIIVAAILCLGTLPKSTMICLTIVAVTWIASQTIIDIYGKKQ
jgi:hypothetical protein